MTLVTTHVITHPNPSFQSRSSTTPTAATHHHPTDLTFDPLYRLLPTEYFRLFNHLLITTGFVRILAPTNADFLLRYVSLLAKQIPDTAPTSYLTPDKDKLSLLD